ncbi:MAG: hypothetical protein CMB64_01530 [Euryarchaeota archaeon]|nr:hypothetical protein [Euryarchaeota archaeon]|tara:strand:- start:18 stop:470 length:453 start_codon:yes stop_codon:yes gene_type:complete
MTDQVNGSSFDVVYIPVEKVQEVFPLVQQEIAKTLDKAQNGYDHNDILKLLNDNAMQLWIVFDHKKNKKLAFIISEIIERPQLNFISIFMTIGENRKIWEVKAQDTLEQFALKNNCSKAILIARKGWSKSFKKTGYKETHTLLEKQLKKG